MNYRHAFHAENFADMVKHIALGRILAYLRQKPTAFRVIDTHAGAGLYDLTGDEAARGGEWRDGIARLRMASGQAAFSFFGIRSRNGMGRSASFGECSSWTPDCCESNCRSAGPPPPASSAAA